MIQFSQNFPRQISEDDNIEMIEEILEDELKKMLHIFHKDKSLGTKRWTIKFFLALYDTIDIDLLHLVEQTRVNCYMHPPVNSTFISLIPKLEHPDTLEDFKSISLCNIIYKVVAKIIG